MAASPQVNGEAIAEANALLVPGGIEFQCHCLVPHAWAALALPPSLLREWLEDASHGAAVDGAVTLIGLAPRAARDLAGALRFAAPLADEVPEMPSAGSRNCLAMALRQTLHSCLTDHPGADRRFEDSSDACSRATVLDLSIHGAAVGPGSCGQGRHRPCGAGGARPGWPPALGVAPDAAGAVLTRFGGIDRVSFALVTLRADDTAGHRDSERPAQWLFQPAVVLCLRVAVPGQGMQGALMWPAVAYHAAATILLGWLVLRPAKPPSDHGGRVRARR